MHAIRDGGTPAACGNALGTPILHDQRSTMPKISIRRASASGPARTMRFGTKTVLVGRSPNCTICLKDPEVSRLHFAVAWRPDAGWVLIRHESARPVWVNDASVDTCRLLGGETIRVGDFTLTFEGDEASDEGDEARAAAAPGLGRASLVIESAFPPGEPLPITKDITVIGRGEACDVVVDDEHCSRNHAEIHAVGGGFVVRDLGSTNGVFVNDARVVADVELRAGDLIRMGESRLRFGLEDAAASSVPTPSGIDAFIPEPEPVLARTIPMRAGRARSPSAATRTVGFVLAGLAGAALTVVVLLSAQAPQRRNASDGEPRRPRAVATRSDRQQESPGRTANGPERRPDSEERMAAAAPPTASDSERAERRPPGRSARPRRPTTGSRADDGTESGDSREVPGSLGGLLDLAGGAGAAPQQERPPAEPTPSPEKAVAEPAKPATADAPEKLLPIPDAADVETAKAEVLAAYGDELSAGGAGDDVIARLIEAARESTRPASKFALLDAAESAALRSASYRQAVGVIDARSRMFDVDNLESRVAMLAGVAKGGASRPRELFDLAVGTVRDAVRTEQFEVASKAVALTTTLAASRELAPDADEPSATKTAHRLWTMVNECKTLHRKYKAAVVSLAERPDDPKAREVMGTYTCFVKQEWTEGLAALAVGRDEQLKAIAARELAVMADGKNVAERFALASAWWAFAESHARPGAMPPWYQDVVREHAADIYGGIVNELSDPVEEKLARKRIALGRAW